MYTFEKKKKRVTVCVVKTRFIYYVFDIWKIMKKDGKYEDLLLGLN